MSPLLMTYWGALSFIQPIILLIHKLTLLRTLMYRLFINSHSTLLYPHSLLLRYVDVYLWVYVSTYRMEQTQPDTWYVFIYCLLLLSECHRHWNC